MECQHKTIQNVKGCLNSVGIRFPSVWTLQAEGELIDKLFSSNLTEEQYNQLARHIGKYPLYIFSNNYTNEQRAEALVSRANQQGLHKSIFGVFIK